MYTYSYILFKAYSMISSVISQHGMTVWPFQWYTFTSLVSQRTLDESSTWIFRWIFSTPWIYLLHLVRDHHAQCYDMLWKHSIKKDEFWWISSRLTNRSGKWWGPWDIDLIGALFWVAPDPNLYPFSWHADKGYPATAARLNWFIP